MFDGMFRRLQYGNMSQVNVTVMLQEDNKAILLVSLEKSDRPYYACDGGCLDEPVQLRYCFSFLFTLFKSSNFATACGNETTNSVKLFFLLLCVV